MKILKTIIITLISISCKSQNPEIDISESKIGLPDGYYSKDLNSNLNQFEGTYLYTNGTTSFKMILVKKTEQYNGRYYEDLIIGEYQYIENGIEKVNTLSQLNTVYNNQRTHNIDGNLIVDNNFRFWKCPTCLLNEKRLCCSIRDASTDRYAHITMRRTTVGSQELMKIKISNPTSTTQAEGQPTPPVFSIPLIEYTLIKL
jgi:hypothetical protein